MAYSETLPVATKSAYRRPYKTRQQRREADKRKVDEGSEIRFLVKVAGGVLLLIIIALVFAAKGLADRESSATPYHSAAGE